MRSEDISADKRLLRKIRVRLELISVRSKVQGAARTEQVDCAAEGAPLPCLYQG
jgi:hypothetical protein